jgi:hypothetical protein
MAEFSEMGELEVWYSRIREEEVRGLLLGARAKKRPRKRLASPSEKHAAATACRHSPS